MIHLFKKVYLSLDCFGFYNSTLSERLYITNNQPEIPITNHPVSLKECHILGYYRDLEEASKEYGDQKGLIEYLYKSDKPTVVICDMITAVKLTTQTYKSIFKNADVDFAYVLHQLVFNNESYMALSDSNVSKKTNIATKHILDGVLSPISSAEFATIHNELPRVPELESILPKDLSIEFLLANYLIDEKRSDVKDALFDKLSVVITKSYIEAFIDLATTLRSRFSSLNRREYDDMELSLSPMENMRKINTLSWVFDQAVLDKDVAAVSRAFSIGKIISIYGVIDQMDLFVSREKNKDLVQIGEMLLTKDFTKIIEQDKEDGKRSSLLSNSRYREKINPLAISYFYRLKRLEKISELEKLKV